MRKINIFIMFIFLLGVNAWGQKAKEIDVRCGDMGAPPLKTRTIKNKAFGKGEKLVYSVNYGVINAGQGILSIPEIIEVAGRETFRIVSTAKSNKVFSVFFKVNDRNECYLDKESLFTWYTERNIREGRYKAHREVVYDHCIRVATRNKKKMTKIPEFALDSMGALYYIRTQDMAVGDTVCVDVYESKDVYTLKIIVHGREKVEVPAGTFDCLKIEPVLKGDAGMFKSKGRLTVWITDDQYKVPVKMESEVIVIGRINAKLEKMVLSDDILLEDNEDEEESQIEFDIEPGEVQNEKSK